MAKNAQAGEHLNSQLGKVWITVELLASLSSERRFRDVRHRLDRQREVVEERWVLEIRLPRARLQFATFGNRQIFIFHVLTLQIGITRHETSNTVDEYTLEDQSGFKAPDKLIASLFEPVLCGVPDH